MSIKLSCLSCGHMFELGDAYDDYEGEIKCWACRGNLEIRLVDGKLKSMKRAASAAMEAEHNGAR